MLIATHSKLPNLASASDAVLRMRHDLTNFLAESMKHIDVTNVMTHAMSTVAGILQVGDVSIPLRDKKNIVIISVGKAAIPMCVVAVRALEAAMEPSQRLRGIAVGPGDPTLLPKVVSYFAGGHPFPNQASWQAAEAALDLLTPLGSDDLVLFLISGGASAMIEAPNDPLITCEQMEEFYRALVYSGLPITSMNALRKHLSKVKGGRLALAASPAQQLSIIISDVPGTDLDMVGSGPSLADPSTIEDCLRILAQPSLRDIIGPRILRYFESPHLLETPKPNHTALRRSSRVCLLSNDILLSHVAQLANRAGYYVEVDVSCDDWHYQDAATFLLNKVRSLRETHKRVCLISGGELSVQVAQSEGLGGRNQHFLLHCAVNLRSSDPPLVLLSVGTDGVDGNSPAAGAIVDSFTLARIAERGLDPLTALERFDSYSLFHALGDTVVTGPTGNNVRDLRIFLSAD
jgi:hydroxypyruvate reductase